MGGEERRNAEDRAGQEEREAPSAEAPEAPGMPGSPDITDTPDTPDSAESSLLEAVGNPHLAALLAWVFPGAGHLYLGRRGRAALFCLLVLTLVVAGVLLQGRLWVPAGDPLHDGQAAVSALFSLVSLGMGAPYGALVATGYHGDVAHQGYEYGSTFLLTAAFMNLLLVFDARDVSLGRKP